MTPISLGVEQHLSGLLDLRYTTTDSFDSYISGGSGKFRYSDGSKLSLAQLAFSYRAEWENNISFHLITNAYGDGEQDGLGITESYFKYRGLPTENGFRYQFRAGFIYPKVSVENDATGWSSPYTLTYSTMNTWIGEETRHLGIETSITKLGKFSGSMHDFSLNFTLFSHNDTNGTLLSWHGWTQSSRQSFWNEMLKFPASPALAPGQPLSTQARQSDPFREVDSKIGYHISGQWDWHGRSKVLLGYYDNRGGTDFVEDGQYNWITRFSHLGIKWKLPDKMTLLFQLMVGDTRMRVANDFDVVGINFDNVFLLLTKKWQRYRFSARIEKFKNDDFDNFEGDDNNEDGEAVTLSFVYQMNKNIFLHIEYNQINSERPSRQYFNLAINAQERQWQLGARYFF